REWKLSNAIRPAEATLTEFLRRHYVACLALALTRLSDLSTATEHQQSSTPRRGHIPGHDDGSSMAASCASSHVDCILEDASLCFSEVIRATYLPSQGVFWEDCWICENAITGSIFKCRSCDETFLCPECHSDYIKGG